MDHPFAESLRRSRHVAVDATGAVLPGVTVTDAALMRSDIHAGLYSLRIKVAPDRIRAFAYADNRGTGSIGRSRVYNSFAISSLARPGDELRVDLFAMPGGHSHYLYGQVAAAVPLGRSRLRAATSICAPRSISKVRQTMFPRSSVIRSCGAAR